MARRDHTLRRIWQRPVVLPLLISTSLVTILFALQGNIGIDISDEGWLWYGVVRTLSGEIPMMDFQSFPPGRYYWCAFFSFLFGDGIIGLRMSVAVFQIIGLTFGLMAARRVIASRPGLILTGMLLVVWMFPRQKLFESSMTMIAIYVAVRFLEDPSRRMYLLAGVWTGVAALMRFNHGLFNFLTFLLLMVFIHARVKKGRLSENAGVWLGGIAIGFLPMLLMLLFIPGYFRCIIDSFLPYAVGSLGLTVPVPWPWRVGGCCGSAWATGIAVGGIFLALPAFYLYGLYAMFRRPPARVDVRRKALFFASVAVGIFCMHHVFSRADIFHLAQNIHPFLLGFLGFLLASRVKRKPWMTPAAIAGLVGVTVLAVAPQVPYLRLLDTPPERRVDYDLNGDMVRLTKPMAKCFDVVREIYGRAVGPSEGFFVAPFWPALYPILGVKCPVWASYNVTAPSPEQQREMIRRLAEAKVNFAIVSDGAMDGRADRRFSQTHPVLWKHLKEDFDPKATIVLPWFDGVLLRRKRRLQ